MQGFVDIDADGGRRRDRQEAAEILAEVAVAEGRAERRQHRQAEPFAGFVRVDKRRRAAAAEQHDLAGEGDEVAQQRGKVLLAAERTGDNQIRGDVGQRRREVRPAAFVGDEAEVAQRLGEKRAHVRLVVDDAGARRNRPVPERNEMGLPRELLILNHETTPLFPSLRAGGAPPRSGRPDIVRKLWVSP